MCVAVGLVENVVPTYQSEIAPAALRGFFVGSIQLCLTTGALVAGIANEVLAGRADASGWQIATGVQAAPAVVILGGLFWTPDSPRWLLSRDRAEDALAALRRVRRPEDVGVGACEVELAAMEEDGRAVGGKGPWKDLYRGSNRRRTNIACAIMTLQQLTGVIFSSTYGPTFYKSVGLGNMAFAYSVSLSALCRSLPRNISAHKYTTGSQQRCLSGHILDRDGRLRRLWPPQRHLPRVLDVGRLPGGDRRAGLQGGPLGRRHARHGRVLHPIPSYATYVARPGGVYHCCRGRDGRAAGEDDGRFSR